MTNEKFIMKKPINIYLHKSIIAIVVLLFCSSSLMAQYVADYKRNADKYYAKGDWYSAAVYYEKYVEQKTKPTTLGYDPYTVQASGKKNTSKQATTSKGASNDNEVVYRIAECYRKLNDYGKATPFYAKADKVAYPLAPYYHAMSLRATGQYAVAETQFESFLKSYSTKDDYTEHAKLELANLKFIQAELAKKDIDAYKVATTAGISVSNGSNYAAWYSGNAIVFTSSRADSSTLTARNKNPYVSNVYTNVSGAVQKFNLPTEAGVEQGAASITADGNRIYFTRWTKTDGKNVSAIYLSENKSGSWTEPVKLGSNVNAVGFSSKQPYVTADGKYLLYASNREGGQGKFDIWYAPLNADGEPGSFLNLGKIINTKDDDESPFYNVASSSLVFATNGRVGMGGFDLFESKGSLPNSFSQPVNLGYPVNSVKDDIYFVNKGSIKLLQDAMISTDRASACCLELFNINKTYKKFVAGIVTDCKTNLPLTDASVVVTDKVSGKIIVTQNTNSKGEYFFEVKEFAPSALAGSKVEYNNAGIEFNAPTTIGSENDTLMNTAFCLVPIEKIVPPDTTEQEPLQDQAAYFNFAKYSLRQETAVMLDTLASILNREKNLGLEILGYTDKLGTTEYNQKLSQDRADACLNYLVKKGVDAAKLKAIGKGECCPIEPETIDGKDNPTGRQANRRVEFKIKLFMK